MGFTVFKFSTIRVLSNDVRKSRDWYAHLFDQEPVEDQDNFVSFKIADAYLDITVPDPKNPFSSGGSIGYWLVDDLNLLLKKVESLGGKLYRGPLQVPEIQRAILQIQDPFGNIVGFEAPFSEVSR
jgi:predicted enzyme related to lactoylglutathione lyase